MTNKSKSHSIKLIPNSADLSVEAMQLMPTPEEMPLIVANMQMRINQLETELLNSMMERDKIVAHLKQKGVL